MSNKNRAFIVTVFIVIFLFIVLFLGIAEHIPFLSKALSLITAVVLIAFVLIFFIIIRKKK
mgnify:CR=1 FL=1